MLFHCVSNHTAGKFIGELVAADVAGEGFAGDVEVGGDDAGRRFLEDGGVVFAEEQEPFFGRERDQLLSFVFFMLVFDEDGFDQGRDLGELSVQFMQDGVVQDEQGAFVQYLGIEICRHLVIAFIGKQDVPSFPELDGMFLAVMVIIIVPGKTGFDKA